METMSNLNLLEGITTDEPLFRLATQSKFDKPLPYQYNTYTSYYSYNQSRLISNLLDYIVERSYTLLAFLKKFKVLWFTSLPS
jgi:hypothetical protein